MSEVIIDSHYHNVGEFIDYLFSDDVRSDSKVKQLIANAVNASEPTASLSTQVDKVSAMWLNAWKEKQGASYDSGLYGHCRASDQAIIRFLGDYLEENDLAMYVPNLGCKSSIPISAGEKPVYQLNGYDTLPLLDGNQWNWENVEYFIDYLVHGAHFVAVSEEIDIGNQQVVSNLYEEFVGSDDLKSDQRDDDGNSHYCYGGVITNGTGVYYPKSGNVDSAADLDEHCPFELSLVVGKTVNSSSKPANNTFMQLEWRGWQLSSSAGGLLDGIKSATGLGTPGRHMADYSTYSDTLWNISTFGASCFSEKRGTAIFLAPSTELGSGPVAEHDHAPVRRGGGGAGLAGQIAGAAPGGVS